MNKAYCHFRKTVGLKIHEFPNRNHAPSVAADCDLLRAVGFVPTAAFRNVVRPPKTVLEAPRAFVTAVSA